MSESNAVDHDAVDLTEDENSSGGSSEDGDIHPMDSSGALLTTKSKIKPPSNSPPEITNSVTMDTGNIPQKEILQDLETVSLYPGNVSEPTTRISTSKILKKLQPLTETHGTMLPLNDGECTQPNPPGKVVIIKKNNKFYKIIIPHNVMPNITQSVGSVLINIPEVGPLVIKNDPQATKIQQSQTKPQQLSLNLDAVEENKNPSAVSAKTSNPIKPKDPPVKTVDVRMQMLRDKKFCWSFNNHRKRDLEGFSFNDRLGFSKSQAVQAMKCQKRLLSITANLEKELQTKRIELAEFKKSSLLKRDKVKLVKINSILEKGGVRTEKFVPPVKVPEFTEVQSEADDYGSDLLVTKKVVILNNDTSNVGVRGPKSVGKKRRKKGKRLLTTVKKGHLKKTTEKKLKVRPHFEIKPCAVHITKNRQVEEAYIKYCRDLGLNVKKKPSITLKSKEKLFYPRVKEKKTNCDNLKATSSPAVSAKPDNSKSTQILYSLIIKTRQKLTDEINKHKPFLILTDQTIGYNRSLEYYCDQFSKNNIFYVVHSHRLFKSSILRAKDFMSAVEIGYIKLVDVNLFCKFALNGMRFAGTKGYTTREDHNYALLQHCELNTES